MERHAAHGDADSRQSLAIELPSHAEGMTQDTEWCRVTVGDRTEIIRFHDYGRIYDVAGLYEHLFYDRLKCSSPQTIARLLKEQLSRAGVAADSLRGLDVGAGNGMVGEELRRLGVSDLVAIDLLQEAADAALRDRPDVYSGYVVGDLTNLSAEARTTIKAVQPNLLTTVAALGFGDIPARAFAEAWNLVATPAWVGFNIKENFLSPEYQYGFSKLIRDAMEAGLLEVLVQHRYQHRLSVAGEPLHYVGIVGIKRGAIPEAWLGDDSLRDHP